MRIGSPGPPPGANRRMPYGLRSPWARQARTAGGFVCTARDVGPSWCLLLRQGCINGACSRSGSCVAHGSRRIAPLRRPMQLRRGSRGARPALLVCIESDAKEGRWVPLFNGPRVGSREIPGSARLAIRLAGHASHYLPRAVWRARTGRAARCGGLPTTRARSRSPIRSRPHLHGVTSSRRSRRVK